MNWHRLLQAIRSQGGPTLELIGAHSVGGGDINDAWRLHCREGDYFIKLNHPERLAPFVCEAHALQAILDARAIRCPRPLAWGKSDRHAFFLMEYLPLSARGSEEARGRALAHLHQRLEPGNRFGWFEDNYIGTTLQPNGWETDWVAFYGEKRLRHQLRLAQSAGAPRTLYEKGCRLIDELHAFFTDYRPRPALLHGDLWGGNSAFTTEGEPVIYDPASYYGDRETDIAMTELFGGFGSRFYDAYREAYPLDEGYQVRKTLYNLYHIINHFNLFGGHYARSAERMIERLLAEI